MTDLILWSMLQTKSRRAMQRKSKKFGHPYTYKPRGDLLRRLSVATGMSEDAVFNQLQKERIEVMRDYF